VRNFGWLVAPSLIILIKQGWFLMLKKVIQNYVSTSHKKPINILYTIPNFDTAGSQQVLYHLAHGMPKAMYNVHIACIHNKGYFFEKIKALGLPIHLIPLGSPQLIHWRTPLLILKLARFIHKNKIDLVHSFQWSSDFTEALGCILGGAKWVYTKKNQSWGNRSWIIKTFLARGVVTINPQMHKTFFPKKKRVHFIPCSVDLARFTPQPSKYSTTRALYAIEPFERVLISIADVIPVKGPDLLIEAFFNLKSTAHHLFFVGNIKHPYAQDLIQNLQTRPDFLSVQNEPNSTLFDQTNPSLCLSFGKQKIHFLGKVSSVENYLYMADLFILPTLATGRSEALGVALLEALACGILSLGSRVPGIEFILEPYPDLLFEPGQVPALENKIKWALKMSPHNRQQLIESLHQRVNNMFNSQIELDKHRFFYQEVLKHPAQTL